MLEKNYTCSVLPKIKLMILSRENFFPQEKMLSAPGSEILQREYLPEGKMSGTAGGDLEFRV